MGCGCGQRAAQAEELRAQRLAIHLEQQAIREQQQAEERAASEAQETAAAG